MQCANDPLSIMLCRDLVEYDQLGPYNLPAGLCLYHANCWYECGYSRLVWQI